MKRAWHEDTFDESHGDITLDYNGKQRFTFLSQSRLLTLCACSVRVPLVHSLLIYDMS